MFQQLGVVSRQSSDLTTFFAHADDSWEYEFYVSKTWTSFSEEEKVEVLYFVPTYFQISTWITM